MQISGSLQVEEDRGTGAEPRIALERLLRSKTLRRRIRLQEFLRFIGEATLDGRADIIKEHTIGAAVFGWPEHVNPGDDTIVRVTARQLRLKVEEYYRDEGRDDPWMVQIPKGSYVPVFGPANPVSMTTAPDIVSPVESQSKLSRLRIAWTITVGLLCLAIGFGGGKTASMQTSSAPALTLIDLMKPRQGRRLSLVSGDAVVQIIKELTGHAPSVGDYQSGKYLDAEELRRATGSDNRTWDLLRSRHLVATGSVQSIATLLQGMRIGEAVVRHPKEVTVRDFVDDSVILLSGPFANPWVQLFENKLGFRLVEDATGEVFFRDIRPLPGQPSEYRRTISRDGMKNYARLAYLPNLSGKGKILLVGGPSALLMERLGAAVAEPEFLRLLAEHFGTKDYSRLPWCEVLMEEREIASASFENRIVSIRSIEN